MLKCELSKIFNYRLVVAIIIFTALFYNLFLNTNYFATCNEGAEDKLCAILQSECGTKFPVDSRDKLEEIRQDNIKVIEDYITNDSVLRQAGIQTYEDYRRERVNNISEEVNKRLDNISFGEYAKESFMVQEVEYWRDWKEALPYAGLDYKKAVKNVKENTRRLTGNLNELEKGYENRKVDLYQRDYVSLLAEDAFECVKADLPLIGLLMLISCVLLIIPYQIKERIRNVNTLFYTTKKGRDLISTRIFVSLMATVSVIVAQTTVFFSYLQIKGIGKYFDCPAYSTARNNAWFDIDFKTYILLNILLFGILIVFAIIVFLYISKLSLNYVIGFASAIPFVVIFALIYVKVIGGFLLMNEMGKSIFYDVWLQIVISIIISIAGIIGMVCLHNYEKRRDVLNC